MPRHDYTWCDPVPEDHRWVECPQCDGEGEIAHGSPDDGWIEKCPECKGLGSVVEVVPLIDEDDIDEWVGETWSA